LGDNERWIRDAAKRARDYQGNPLAHHENKRVLAEGVLLRHLAKYQKWYVPELFPEDKGSRSNKYGATLASLRQGPLQPIAEPDWPDLIDISAWFEKTVARSWALMLRAIEIDVVEAVKSLNWYASIELIKVRLTVFEPASRYGTFEETMQAWEAVELQCIETIYPVFVPSPSDIQRLIGNKKAVPIRMAAKILGITDRHARRLVESGILVEVEDSHPRKVTIESLLKHGGTVITDPTWDE
jgi:hypothetical protein